MRVDNPHARSFYEVECVKNNWSVRELERQAVVRYTLAQGNKQIFASRYKVYLPTKQELIKEMRRERLFLEYKEQIK